MYSKKIGFNPPKVLFFQCSSFLALTNLSVLHASLHGLISTFVVLIIHKPYRQFIILIFKSPSVVHKESVTTMRKMNGLTSRVTMNKLLNTLR